MKDRNSDYLHGTHPREQQRLSRLNALLNANSLRAIGVGTGERILDVGSGLGQFSRMLARAVGSSGAVIGVEHDTDQLAEAHRQARDDLAFRFLDAAGACFQQLIAMPAVRIARKYRAPKLEGVRMWRIAGLDNYLIF